MNLLECQEEAMNDGANSRFVANFPAGKMVCQFVDPWLGIFIIEESDSILNRGYLKIADVIKIQPNIECEYLGLP